MEGTVIEYTNENGDTKIIRNIAKLGEGSYGIVYRALLDGFGEIAVKYQTRFDISDIKSALLEYRKAPLLEKHSIVVRKIVVANASKIRYPILNDPAVSITTSDLRGYKILFIYDLAVGVELFDVINLQVQSMIPFTLATIKQYASQLLEGIIEIRNA